MKSPFSLTYHTPWTLLSGSALVGPRIIVSQKPSISGNTTQGDTLTGADGAASGVGPTTVTARQWLRDGAPISGATNSTYILTETDKGKLISFKVNWTDDNQTISSYSIGLFIPINTYTTFDTLYVTFDNSVLTFDEAA